MPEERSAPPAPSTIPRILLIEQDATLSAFLRHNLEIEGYRVDAAQHSADLPARFRVDPPDLIVLDWTTTDNSALDLCRRFRVQRETAGAPIVALTAPGAETDNARQLVTRNLDRFVKPFSIPAFVARVHALLRSVREAKAASIAAGDLELDALGHRVTRKGRQVELYPAEFRLLEFLMRNPGKVLSREQLIAGAWGRGEAVDIRAIDVNIRRIRSAISRKGLSDPIRTVRRRGYAFDPGS